MPMAKSLNLFALVLLVLATISVAAIHVRPTSVDLAKRRCGRRKEGRKEGRGLTLWLLLLRYCKNITDATGVAIAQNCGELQDLSLG